MEGLWARTLYKICLESLLGSPRLPCMRLGSKTYQSYHLLLPTKPRGKAEVVTLTSPFLSFFGCDVHITGKVRKGFGLSWGGLSLQPPHSFYGLIYMGLKSRGKLALAWVSQRIPTALSELNTLSQVLHWLDESLKTVLHSILSPVYLPPWPFKGGWLQRYCRKVV